MRQTSYDIIQWLVVAPVFIPLLFSALCLMLTSFSRVSHIVCVFALIIQLGFSLSVFLYVREYGTIAMTMGEWLPPFGISFNVDLFGVLLSFVANCLGLLIFIYATQEISLKLREFGFHSLFLLLIAGVNGAFLTGDIFNLYVWFEVILISSFGLLVYGGNTKQFDGGIKYSVLNLLATTFFLISVIFLYSITGTLNMADLSRLAYQEFDFGNIGYILIFSMGMKAALFPLFFWLPASYHVPFNSMSALFGGLLTKVGAYTLYRMYTTVLYNSVTEKTILLWLGILTVLSASIMLLAERQLRRQLGFLVISGIGMLMIAIGLDSIMALAAGVFYFVHSMLTISMLYLLIGMFSSGNIIIGQNYGYYKVNPFASTVVLIGFFIVSGLPPFSGFWPKIILIQEALKMEHYVALVSIGLTSFFILMGLTRSYALVFWYQSDKENQQAKKSMNSTQNSRILSYFSLRMITVLMLFFILVFVGMQPEYLGSISFEIADMLVQPGLYIEGVFGNVR